MNRKITQFLCQIDEECLKYQEYPVILYMVGLKMHVIRLKKYFPNFNVWFLSFTNCYIVVFEKSLKKNYKSYLKILKCVILRNEWRFRTHAYLKLWILRQFLAFPRPSHIFFFSFKEKKSTFIWKKREYISRRTLPPLIYFALSRKCR